MTIAIWCILSLRSCLMSRSASSRGLTQSTASRVGEFAGRSARAYGAHLNALETFPLFAAAVIVAHMIGGPSRIADVLAVVYVLLRIGHLVGLRRRPSAAAVGGVRVGS